MGTDARMFTVTVAFKVLILLLESKNKTAWLHWDPEKHSPEESSGFFDLGLFTWLTRLFIAGYSSVLSIDNLYSLDESLSSEKMYDQLSAFFGKKSSPGSRYRLATALGKALMGPLLMPVLPRLVLLGFTFSQPFFLASVLSTLAQKGQDDERSDGFGLIGAAAMIYTGIALSRAFYGYFSQRVVAMARGCLVSAVYAKTTKLPSLAGDDAAAITLMSTDIERVTMGMEKIHDVWADLVQVSLGCWLLQRKLGSAFLAPVIVVLCCGLLMVWLGRASAKTQASWMGKIQSRVGMTSKVIMHIKQVKISGIAQTIEEIVQDLRVNELRIGNKYRIVLVLTSTVSFAPQSLSAVLAFALAGRDLDVSAMYESLAYLVLLTAPLSMFFQRIPDILSAITCLERIQEYLESEPRQDYRATSNQQRINRLSSASSSISSTQTTTAIELRRMDASGSHARPEEIALYISNGTFGWKVGQSVLTSISISLPLSQLAFVIGPVASGKSSLCKAILGEVPIAAGEVRLHPSFSSAAFCDQIPFLVSGTLRQNIVGHLVFDQARFTEVVWAAALTEDIASLPNSDGTDIGTNGTTLSGGQKARVSLARALYDRSSLLILDDVFSGLDNNTAAKVFDRVFGPVGLLRRRGATALVCTHSMRHVSLADHVIVLGPEGTIVEQGPYSTLERSHAATFMLQGANEQYDSLADATKDSLQAPETIRPKTDDAITKALDDRSRQLGDWKVYKHYMNSMNKLHLLVMLAGCVMLATGWQLPTVWVGLWANDSLHQSTSFYIGIYGAVNSLIIVGVSIVAWTAFVPMTIDVGRELHRRALWTVMHAPLRLFTTTDTGTITNLFSQDTTIIDSELSMYLLNFLANVALIVASGFVIALASPYLAVSYPFLIAIGYCIQMFYLRTSRQLRLLDLEAKSPL
jgi:ATP-binding cassette subfamily C (CFTR/MRP) protein 1